MKNVLVVSVACVAPDCFLGKLFFTFDKNGTRTSWFTGSKGSPPRTVSPEINSFERASVISFSVSSVKSFPY